MRLIPSLLLCLALPALARAPQAPPRPSSRLLRCLGVEEKRFHAKKQTGAVYDLNQRLIGELVMINKIEGQKVLLDRICDKKSYSPSVGLMEAMLLMPYNWAAPGKTGTEIQDTIQRELIKDLNAGMPEIFLNFLGQLQAESPTPQCLNEKIPSIKSLNEDVKWLQEEVDLDKITGKRKRLQSIFAGIHQVEKLYAECREAQSKAKSKSTDKPAGKPSPK